jgi:esterase/lipase superfamily enzyme
MPAPVGISTGASDPFIDTPEKEKDSNILVGYATNRMPIGAREARFYTRSFDEDLRMGVVTIQIGDGNDSWDEIRELSINDAYKGQILLTLANAREVAALGAGDSLETLSPTMAKMMGDFNQYIERSPSKEITLYVHGANNNFYRSAAQAAQYRHFTGRQSVVLMFSWPSAESIVRYGTDVNNIQRTVPAFLRYLRLLAKHSSARKINILAYSAGATLVNEALAILGEDSSNADRQSYRDSLRIGTVYFAAPDTDFDDWVKQYRSYQDIVDDVTVTINMEDSVLAMAQTDRSARAAVSWQDETPAKSRLGRPDMNEIDTADAEWLVAQTNTDRLDVLIIDPATIPGIEKGSHSFWYQSPWVSNDAMLNINLHASPANRGLAEHKTERGTHIWYFPADYEDRIVDTIDKLNNEYNR